MLYGDETQRQDGMPDDRDIAKKVAMNEGAGHLLAEEDRPMSSTESAMRALEEEIMMLDEAFSSLQRRLKPVMNNSIEKAAMNETEADRAVRRPESAMAQSVNEKANRIRQIRRRIEGTTRGVDL